jgi:hypothetical protein
MLLCGVGFGADVAVCSGCCLLLVLMFDVDVADVVCC